MTVSFVVTAPFAKRSRQVLCTSLQLLSVWCLLFRAVYHYLLLLKHIFRVTWFSMLDCYLVEGVWYIYDWDTGSSILI